MFTRDITVTGSHAARMKFLSEKTKELEHDNANVAGVFKRFADVYLVAPIIGVVLGRKSERNNENSVTAQVKADVVNQEQLNLKFIYRTVMLVDNSRRLTADEKLVCAFKEEGKDENMEIFDSYVRGGIDWMYEQFTDGASRHEEYINRIYEIVQNFFEDYCGAGG